MTKSKSRKKITALIKNITVKELEIMLDALNEYRHGWHSEEKK